MKLDLGKMIRDAREARGWSQEHLAEKVGATQSTVDRIERGLTQRSRYIHSIVAELGLVKYAADYVEPVPTLSEMKGDYRFNIILQKNLVDSIYRYKRDYQIISDNEAIRNLIEEGIMHLDTFMSVTDRLWREVSDKKPLRVAARKVLGNHPLIVSIRYGDDGVTFVMSDHYKVHMDDSGVAKVWDDTGSLYEHSVGDEPDWAHPDNIDPPERR